MSDVKLVEEKRTERISKEWHGRDGLCIRMGRLNGETSWSCYPLGLNSESFNDPEMLERTIADMQESLDEWRRLMAEEAGQ